MASSKQYVFQSDNFVDKLRLMSASRIFIATTMLAATLVIHPGAQNDDIFNAFLFVTICHVAVAVLFFFSERVMPKRYLQRFAYIQIVWDIIFHTSIIYLTGGVSSQYKFLYWISILFSSILFLRIGAIVAASMSALCYAILVDLDYFQSLPQFMASFRQFEFSSERPVIHSIMVNVLIFAFIGFVSSIITTRLSLAEANVLEQDKKLKDLEEKIMRSKHLASVGEMAARIAHEIRNPLTSVSASMEMLSKSEKDGSSEGMILDIARREARRLNQLLTDFLDYARPSMPDFQKAFLSKLIDESVQLFKQGYPSIEFEIDNRIQEEKKMKLDVRMISQLFWNIFKNASEAMGDRGKITIRMHDEFVRRYVIEVIDSGEGFDDKNAEKLFEPFFIEIQRNSLGLSIAYRVMQDHHGTIQLEPNQTQGCTCRLTFPLEFKEITNA
ncbi:MAG: ATP-binding protein [Bdellovibrionota bacterium]